MSILETAVHNLTANVYKNLLGSYPAPRPHLAVLSTLVIFLYRQGKSLCGRNDVGETAPLIHLHIAARIT